ncbi:MAG TPA: hypothetical protein VMI75_37385, partial [Polyangiaceae bacterium]|nr:hypothetical protein [Polyangiaceae bacterium]
MDRRLDFVLRENAGYIDEQYRRWQADPTSVAEDWALFFAGMDFAGTRGAAAEGPAAPAGPPAGVPSLVHAYREFGHLAARLDPLGLQHDDRHAYLE